MAQFLGIGHPLSIPASRNLGKNDEIDGSLETRKKRRQVIMIVHDLSTADAISRQQILILRPVSTLGDILAYTSARYDDRPVTVSVLVSDWRAQSFFFFAVRLKGSHD